jgi:hypothetical protein
MVYLPSRMITPRFYVLVVFSAIGCLLAASSTKAQGSARPLHVRSDQVLVPAIVWDDHLWQDLLLKRPRDPAAFEKVAIRGLTASDFQVFEDGKEQKVQQVIPQDPYARPVWDDNGEHYEFVGTGGGRWIYPDILDQSKMPVVLTWPTYLVVYAPPNSSNGSCHRVDVKIIDRPDATLLARSGYCKTSVSEADPLIGTRFGSLLESDLTSQAKGNIPLHVAAVVSFADTSKARVHLVLRFSPKDLRHTLRYNGILHLDESIGMLAKIYAKDGTLVSRLSDFDCCDYGNGAGLDWLIIGNRSDFLAAPNGFETQIYLMPGEYILTVVLSDGHSFGRVAMPLRVERSIHDELAMSDVALARRFRESRAGSENVSSKLVGSYVPLVSKSFSPTPSLSPPLQQNGPFHWLEFTPTAATTFERKDHLYYYFEIYSGQLDRYIHSENANPAPPIVDYAESIRVHLRIVNERTGQSALEVAPFSAAPLMKESDSVIPVGGGIDISNFSKGHYRVEAQVTDSSGQSTPWRHVSFEIK